MPHCAKIEKNEGGWSSLIFALCFHRPPRSAVFPTRTRGREWRLPCRIQSKVEDAVAEKMLDGTLKTGDTAKLAVEDDKLVVTK